MRILIADDDRTLAESVRKSLVDEGHTVDLAHDGDDAWLFAAGETYDVIVLDIMLPRRSGLDVLRALRSEAIPTPVLLLTARVQMADKVRGLDLGADDYMTKPFVLVELLARVRALGRRRTQIDAPALTCGDLVLDRKTRQVFRGARAVELTVKEFALLEYLLMHKGTVVARTDIMEKVWDVNFDSFSEVVKVVISRLRKKLESGGEPALIQTVRGVGYTLKEPEDGAQVPG